MAAIRIHQKLWFKYSPLWMLPIFCEDIKRWMGNVCELADRSQVNRFSKVHTRDHSSPFLGTTQLHSSRAQLGLHYVISSAPLKLLFGFLVDLAKEVCETQSNLTIVATNVPIQHIFFEYLLYARHCTRYWDTMSSGKLSLFSWSLNILSVIGW